MLLLNFNTSHKLKMICCNYEDIYFFHYLDRIVAHSDLVKYTLMIEVFLIESILYGRCGIVKSLELSCFGGWSWQRTKA